MLYYTAFTDPGILPSIYLNSGIPCTEELVPNPKREYYCEYQKKVDLIHTMHDNEVYSETDKFFSPMKFHYLPLTLQQNRWGNEYVIDYKKKHNKLSYCKTCKILRPPRAFHCATCGVCVEQHDHHCPWVGTCIGYRNLKFFVSFLFWTLFLAILTLIICSVVIATCSEQMNQDEFSAFKITTCVILSFSAICSFFLLIFFLHQLCALGVKNKMTNEDLRFRWNGHPRNKKMVKIYSKQAGLCNRISYVMCGNVNKVYGISKLKKYSNLVENYYKMKRMM